MITNQEKYAQYQIQNRRLRKAISNEFYLEAILIEYAIMEDRLESVLRHSNVYNPEKHNSLNRKIRRIEELRRAKKSALRNYLSEELLNEIENWKEERNGIVHCLMKNNVNETDLKEVALTGQRIAKVLCSKATSYRRFVEKQRLKKDGADR